MAGIVTTFKSTIPLPMVEATAVPISRAGQIKKSRHRDRLTRSQDLGRNDRCDRVRGVVEAVDVFEEKGRQDDDNEENHAGLLAGAQEYLSTTCRMMLPASRHRSITFSSSS